MRMSKLKTLSKLLPLVISMTGGLASPASALELSATEFASRISDALRNRQLPTAQEAVSQLFACNVRAIRINGVDYRVEELQTTINRLASGEDVPVPPRSTQAAAFVLEPGGFVGEGALCDPGERIAPVVAVFPVGSQGTPST